MTVRVNRMGRLKDVLDKLRSQDEDEFPFEVDGVYYNEDAGDRFVVKQIEPEFKVWFITTNDTYTMDPDIYQWKYEKGKIYEVDDGQ